MRVCIAMQTADSRPPTHQIEDNGASTHSCWQDDKPDVNSTLVSSKHPRFFVAPPMMQRQPVTSDAKTDST
jgi:hypothetical protein